MTDDTQGREAIEKMLAAVETWAGVSTPVLNAARAYVAQLEQRLAAAEAENERLRGSREYRHFERTNALADENVSLRSQLALAESYTRMLAEAVNDWEGECAALFCGSRSCGEGGCKRARTMVALADAAIMASRQTEGKK